MLVHERGIERLAKEFEACQKALSAIGDASRQHLILSMMRMEHCGGARVETIAAESNLSRPTVSHHLQILKDAGIIKIRREGTKHDYYFDIEQRAMNQLIQMLLHTKAIMEKSLDWICNCAADDNCLLVAANHDPAVKEQVIVL